MEQKYIERLIRYCRISTPSCFENADSSPSTACQWDLQRLLEQELKEMGLEPQLTPECVLYCLVNGGNKNARVVLVTHVDVSPEAPGINVAPQVIKRTGPSVVLPNGVEIAEEQLSGVLVGDTLVTTDGTTLLGGDDKAGIACVMELVEQVQRLPESERRKIPSIMLCFTPDEEICCGCKNVSIEKLTDSIEGAFGVTLDGTRTKQITFETFNAWSFTLRARGFNIHPGQAFGRMVNASMVIAECVKQISDSIPAPSESHVRESFVLCNHVSGTVEEATLTGIVRAFDKPKGLELISKLDHIRQNVQELYPKAIIELSTKEQYQNMRQFLPGALVERFTLLGQQFGASFVPFRGGTDGSLLSVMGLPTPNIWDGAGCFHSVREYVCVRESLEAIEFLKRLLGL